MENVAAAEHARGLADGHLAEADGAGVVLAHPDVRGVHDHLRQRVQHRVRGALRVVRVVVVCVVR